MVDFIDRKEDQKRTHADMSSAMQPIGSVALWYGKGRVEYRGNFQLGFTKDSPKFNLVLFGLDPDKPTQRYIYSGLVSLHNPDNAWEIRQHREHNAYVEETRIGKCYFYEGEKGSLYLLVYLDTGQNYRLRVKESKTDNMKAPVLTGVVFPLQDQAVKDKRDENIKRKVVRREVGAGKNRFFEQEPTTASEVIEVLFDSPLTDDDYIDIMLALLTKFGSLTQFKEAATERLARKEPEPEVHEEQDDDDEELDYEEITERPTSVEIPTIVPVMPKERIAEVVKNSEYKRPDKVGSLNIRLSQVSSNLVEGIDEEGDLV